jgi:hypothetical protein
MGTTVESVQFPAAIPWILAGRPGRACGGIRPVPAHEHTVTNVRHPARALRRRTIVALAAALLLATALFLPGCRLAQAFRGPGWDPERGVVLP